MKPFKCKEEKMEGGRKRCRWASEVEFLTLDSGLSSSLQLLGVEVMSEKLGVLVPEVIKALNNPNPRVRWAAADTVRALSVSLGSGFEAQYPTNILRPLIALIGDQNPTVRTHAAVALQYLSKHCTPDILKPLLTGIVVKLRRLLHGEDENSKLAALGALGIIASSSKDFSRLYYDSTMPFLKAILLSEAGGDKRFLCSTSLKCISYVAIAGAKDKFKSDFEEVMEALKSLQVSLTGTDHMIRVNFLQALVNLCSCMGQDFFIYVNDLMPVLIQSANIKPVNDSLRALALSEKALACEMISCCASQFKEKFFPWFDKVADILVPLLEFDLHFETRTAAISAMPELLRSAILAVQKGQSEGKSSSDIQKVAIDIIRKLREALKSQEKEKEISARLLKSLNECIEVSGLYFTEAPISYSDMYLRFLLDSCGDDNPDVREEALRGIGVCVNVDAAGFKTHATEAVERLHSVIAQSDNGKAHAAAVSALGKICEFHLQSSNVSEVAKWLDYLPLTTDKTEAKVVHEQLCSMVERFQAELLGTDNQQKSRIFAILNEVVADYHNLATEDTARRMVSLVFKFE